MPVLRWTHDPSAGARDLSVLLDELVTRMREAGLPVSRAHLALPTLHPEFLAHSAVWREDGPTEEGAWDRTTGQLPTFVEAPLRPLMEGETDRIEVPDLSRGGDALPNVDELRRDGVTGYLAYSVSLEGGAFGTFTLSTRAPGGFTEDHRQMLRPIRSAIRGVLSLHVLRGITENICRAYIGPQTGPRVLAGEIERGSITTLRAVVWFCDLRGFTALTEELGAVEVVTVLNEFFAIVGAAVQGQDGEILKFIGDAALAIFRIDGDDEGPVQRAFAAARAALRGVERWNADRVSAGAARLGFGIGLHLGEVSYGNIGAPGRLDFTVIGPAVNQASRLESLCGATGEPLLASAEFAAMLGAGLVGKGRHQLKGISSAVPVFGLPGS